MYICIFWVIVRFGKSRIAILIKAGHIRKLYDKYRRNWSIEIVLSCRSMDRKRIVGISSLKTSLWLMKSYCRWKNVWHCRSVDVWFCISYVFQPNSSKNKLNFKLDIRIVGCSVRSFVIYVPWFSIRRVSTAGFHSWLLLSALVRWYCCCSCCFL